MEVTPQKSLGTIKICRLIFARSDNHAFDRDPFVQMLKQRNVGPLSARIFDGTYFFAGCCDKLWVLSLHSVLQF